MIEGGVIKKGEGGVKIFRNQKQIFDDILDHYIYMFKQRYYYRLNISVIFDISMVITLFICCITSY